MVSHDNDKSQNIILLSIIAIVAIVGIVVIINDAKAPSAGIALTDNSKDSSGAAIAGEEISGYCYDGDSGKNYNVKGTSYYSPDGIVEYSMSDFCRNYDSEVLVEYNCVGNELTDNDYVCPYGCSNGRCLERD